MLLDLRMGAEEKTDFVMFSDLLFGRPQLLALREAETDR